MSRALSGATLALLWLGGGALAQAPTPALDSGDTA